MQIQELEYTNLSLLEISELKDKNEILVPLSQGIFTKAELRQDSKLIVNIGAGVAVEKDFNQTKEIVNKQITDAMNERSKFLMQLENYIEKAENIQMEITGKQNV